MESQPLNQPKKLRRQEIGCLGTTKFKEIYFLHATSSNLPPQKALTEPQLPTHKKRACPGGHGSPGTPHPNHLEVETCGSRSLILQKGYIPLSPKGVYTLYEVGWKPRKPRGMNKGYVLPPLERYVGFKPSMAAVYFS